MPMSTKRIAIILLVLLLIVEAGFIVWQAREKRTRTERVPVEVRKAPNNPDLTAGERDLFLTRPITSSTVEERLGHMTKAAALAVESSEVSLDSCRPTPVVARLKSGRSIAFKNESDEPTTLVFLGADHSIAASGVIEIGPLSSGDNNQSRRLIPYGCNKEGSVGYIYVSP
jgi:hypothetical protein